MPEGLAFDVNTVLAVVSVLLFVGLVGYFAFLVRHQEQVEPEEKPVYGVELLEQHYAPGATVEQPTPYFVAPIPASPDPLEISSNLDKKIVLGAALLFGIFAMIGGYFVIQPTIRANAAEDQLRIDVERGKHLFAQYCYDCHGRDGKAGKTPDGKTLPGLPLNKPDFKYENVKADPARITTTRTLIVNTITRGRPFAPPRYSMPAWGRSDGGPLSDWQVKQLADLIMYGTDGDWGDIATIREEDGQPLAEQIPSPPAAASGEDTAKTVCTVCHTFTAGANSPNPLAPNLATYGKDGPFNDQLKALKASGDPDWLIKWVTNPPSVKPGTAMPPYGASAGGQLSDDTVKQVVTYVLGLGK
jgi:mono/diheme cytochrome c family protein